MTASFCLSDILSCHHTISLIHLQDELILTFLHRDDAARALQGQGKLKEAREYRMGGPNARQGVVCGSTPCSKFAASYEKYLTCGQCRAIWYCNKNCQPEDWKRHKKFCKSQPAA